MRSGCRDLPEGVRRCFNTGAQPRALNCDGPKRSLLLAGALNVHSCWREVRYKRCVGGIMGWSLRMWRAFHLSNVLLAGRTHTPRLARSE
jgi:hypothetical protein